MDGVKTWYVTCHPSWKEVAEGYGAGMIRVAGMGIEDDDRLEIVPRDDCPVDKVYVTSKPLDELNRPLSPSA